MTNSSCRFCNTALKFSFADLGMSPLSNSYINKENLNKKEAFYPLHAYVCEECLLVQLEEFETPNHIFEDYLYFSSYSESWLKHAKNYSDMISEKLQLNSDSFVIEVASNDGYLLQNFLPKNIPVLGIEPAKNVAEFARNKGIETISDFFGEQFAENIVKQKGKADLIIANNVLAHVPDLNDFIKGFKALLKPEGTVTVEFPHLLELIRHNQFDTIYHEHFSYFSILALNKAIEHHGLKIYDIECLATHGGSLRTYICHADNKSKKPSNAISEVIANEKSANLDNLEIYLNFHENIEQVKYKLLDFLITQKNNNKSVVAYGAPAKGNTLLNYCGIKSDLLAYTVDRSPHKQGLFLPGTHIPIFPVSKIIETQPDFILILPWNLSDEITGQLPEVAGWNGKFVTPIPELKIL